MKKQIQSKEEYLKELEILLKTLPEAERQNALKYYEEYFSEAGEENELSVINELGDVSLLADKIKGEEIFKEVEKTEKVKEEQVQNKNDVLAILLLIAILIFGIPVIFPVILSVIGVLIALACAGIGICIAGIGCFCIAIVLFFSEVFKGILALGVSFILLAVGIALSIAIGFVLIKVVPSLIRWFVKLCRKAIGREE